MERLEIAVCEDDKDEQRRLVSLIEEIDGLCDCAVFPSGEAFLMTFQEGKYDLVFMDIYMGGITGIETVASLRQTDDSVPVAFVTTSSEHTLESYRLDAIKYIEKPVTEKNVRELLELAHLKKENRPQLRLRQDGEEVGVPFDRILYAEQSGHDLLLHLTAGDTLRVSGERLDEAEQQFDRRSFFRCHKSYLVNLAFVVRLDRDLMVFTMKDGENVHIRRESLAEARRIFENYLFGRARRRPDE